MPGDGLSAAELAELEALLAEDDDTAPVDLPLDALSPVDLPLDALSPVTPAAPAPAAQAPAAAEEAPVLSAAMLGTPAPAAQAPAAAEEAPVLSAAMLGTPAPAVQAPAAAEEAPVLSAAMLGAPAPAAQAPAAQVPEAAEEAPVLSAAMLGTPAPAAQAPAAQAPTAAEDVPATPAPAAPVPAEDDATRPELFFGPAPLHEIPDNLHRAFAAKTPGRMRLVAAQAKLPMPPKDMVVVVHQLRFDAHPKVRAAADATFAGFDERILGAVLGEALPGAVLAGFAHALIGQSSFLEKVLLNPQTPDAAFAHVAEFAEDHKVIAIVAGNQQRLMRDPGIVRALARSAHALRSDLDRALDFLARQGVILDDVPEFADAFQRLGRAEQLEAVQKIQVGREHLTAEQQVEADALGISAEDMLLLEEDDEVDSLAAAEAKAEKEAEDPGPQRRVPLNKYSIPIQIKLAMMGDHSRVVEALKSSNKLVSSAGIKNPRVRDNDVARIAHNKTLADEVVRYICNNREWTKRYGIRMALLKNPKTPMSLAMRWLSLLRDNDLKSLAKSKAVPTAVSAQARRLAQKRTRR